MGRDASSGSDSGLRLADGPAPVADATVDARAPVDAADDHANPADAGTLNDSSVDGAARDAPSTYVPCNEGTNVLSYFVTGSYGGLPSGPGMLAEVGSSWAFTFTYSSELEIDSPSAPMWGLSLISNMGTSTGGDIAVGMFTCEPPGHADYAGFWINGDNCDEPLGCSVTIEQLDPPGQGTPVAFKASFSFTCPDSGTVVGCVNYHNP